MNVVDSIAGYFAPFKKENLPSKLFPERFVPDPQITYDASAAREMRDLDLQGLLTLDTEKPVMMGRTLYNGSGLDPETVYHPYGENKKYYESIPNGYMLEEEGGRAFDTPENIENRRILRGVKDYIVNGYPGSRITPEYFDFLASNLDRDTLLRALAMSIAETGAGRDASTFRPEGGLKENNYWGIHISKDGDPSNYYDPEREVMVEDLNRNFGPEAPYSTINRDTLAWYVKGKAYKDLNQEQKKTVDDEYGRYLWARNQFGI
jgi:hypothetical protein